MSDLVGNIENRFCHITAHMCNASSHYFADITGKSCELMKNLCVDDNGMPMCKHGSTCHQSGNTMSCECTMPGR